MAEIGAAIDRQAILTLRRQVRFQDGRPYDARCSNVAAALEVRFGWKRRFGRLRLPSDLVDYTARALRVRALLAESMTSGQLDELLVMYEWAQAAAARGGLWMSSEYAAVLD